jgi:hypothetical protein
MRMKSLCVIAMGAVQVVAVAMKKTLMAVRPWLVVFREACK